MDRHAIVVGGGMAGLQAAHALARRFARVTLFERDDAADLSGRRPGVPQARHTHVLLTGGLRMLEARFHGLREELVAAGATPIDYARDFKILGPYGWVVRPSGHLAGVHATRLLLEGVIRARVAADPAIELCAGRRVTGLVGDRARVRGVQLGDESVPADLVVDASGRSSRFPAWLEALGVAPPRETVIDAGVGYATRVFERPAAARDWTALYVFPVPWADGRAGSIFPAENGQWQVGLTGAGGDHPPTEHEGWMAFARSLRSPELHEAIRDAVPISPIAGNRSTQNRLRLPRAADPWPEGFVVMGDAGCHANPVYGQGMTLAALQTAALERALDDGDGDGLARRFHQRARRALLVPWQLAITSDRRVPGCQGPPPPRGAVVNDRLMDGLMSLASEQAPVAEAFLEVMHMVRPPWSLLRPHIALRAARAAVRLTLSPQPDYRA